MSSTKFVGLAVLLATACAPGEQAYDGVETNTDPLYVLTTVLWPGGSMPVCWEATGQDLEKTWVRSAVGRTWEKSAQVSFTGWGQCPTGSFAGLRIGWADVGPHTKGLGTQLRGVANGMVLNATFGTWSPTCASNETTRQYCIESIAVHEFGHALGFAHEQNRPDTPSTCTEPPQGSNGNATYGSWDLTSVMNYCNPAWNNNGNLSDIDKAGAARYYGGPMCDGGSASWTACRGTGCSPCTEKLASYPLYTFNHPKCTLNPTCGGQYYPCSNNCPSPTSADVCNGSSGQWSGCRGNGCAVCQERIAGYPNYLKRHPKCTLNTLCGGEAYTCSSNCPAPTALDR